MSKSKPDKTRFTQRSFAVITNHGRNIRLINRDDPKWAISIPWVDLPALRELIDQVLKESKSK